MPQRKACRLSPPDPAKQRDGDSETYSERPDEFFLLFLDGTCGEDFDEDGEEDAE